MLLDKLHALRREVILEIVVCKLHLLSQVCNLVSSNKRHHVQNWELLQKGQAASNDIFFDMIDNSCKFIINPVLNLLIVPVLLENFRIAKSSDLSLSSVYLEFESFECNSFASVVVAYLKTEPEFSDRPFDFKILLVCIRLSLCFLSFPFSLGAFLSWLFSSILISTSVNEHSLPHELEIKSLESKELIFVERQMIVELLDVAIAGDQTDLEIFDEILAFRENEIAERHVGKHTENILVFLVEDASQ